MDSASRDAQPAQWRGATVIEQPWQDLCNRFNIDPSERSDDSASQRGVGPRYVEYMRDGAKIESLHGQHRGRENAPRIRRFEVSRRHFPGDVTSETQSIQMRFDALIELTQPSEVIKRVSRRCVPQPPQEAEGIDVLLGEIFVDFRAQAALN